jgi:guanosine-3',5'-bis(diphosphate) 3'-pyrophosphohydrolase
VSPAPAAKPSPSAGNSPIAGVEGLLYHIAGCCHPLPGESIIGVVNRGAKGISIHRQGCPNVDQVEGERLIPVRWNAAAQNGHTYPVSIIIEAIDRVGILMEILARLSEEKINVRDARVKTSLAKPALISLELEIRDHAQLEVILTKIKNMSDVLALRRVNGLD